MSVDDVSLDENPDPREGNGEGREDQVADVGEHRRVVGSRDEVDPGAELHRLGDRTDEQDEVLDVAQALVQSHGVDQADHRDDGG